MKAETGEMAQETGHGLIHRSGARRMGLETNRLGLARKRKREREEGNGRLVCGRMDGGTPRMGNLGVGAGVWSMNGLGERGGCPGEMEMGLRNPLGSRFLFGAWHRGDGWDGCL